MNITTINPLLYSVNKKSKKMTQEILICVNTPQKLGDSLAYLSTLKTPFFFIPSPQLFWDTDFMEYDAEIKNVLKDNEFLFYLNDESKVIKHDYTGQTYKMWGSLFWSDFEGLNEELVTLSLIKSPHFQKIKAEQWFDNSKNLEQFYEINEHLKKNNIYYKTVKQYYKSGYFHPIISYLLYRESLEKMIYELKRPFHGQHIVLSHNQPLDYGFYFENQQNKLSDTLSYDYFLKKASLDIAMSQLSIDYVIHGNASKNYYYKYGQATIIASNLSHQTIELENAFENSVYKNTLHSLIQENQKFINVIKQSILDNENPFILTESLMNFIKTYNYLFGLIYKLKKMESLIDNFKNLTVSNLGISEQEVQSDILGRHLQSQRIKFILNTLSHNQFALQNMIAKIK